MTWHSFVLFGCWIVVATTTVRYVNGFSSSGKVPSWKDMEKAWMPSYDIERPVELDPALLWSSSSSSRQREEVPVVSSLDRPMLFRERHGWCPYSERVWLALEVKGVEYDTVKIDNTGHGRRPSYFRGTTPQMRWPEEQRMQGESMDLVRELQRRYPNHGIDLYPDDIEDDVMSHIQAFSNIFPKGARPSSRAAFLFRYDGEPLWESEFRTVLQRTNDLLSSQSSGPFFCGDRFTAADIAWAPFLERYAAQLPCLHEGLSSWNDEYPHLYQWHQAMITSHSLSAYPCRVKGNASSWRKVLTMAGYGNAGNVPSMVQSRMDELSLAESQPLSHDDDEQQQSMWESYISTRPHLASTPSAEAAATICRNRHYILSDISKNNIPLNDDDDPEKTMRALTHILFQNATNVQHHKDLLPDIGQLATFLDHRMCVPRDMGSMSAACIKRLAYQLSSSS